MQQLDKINIRRESRPEITGVRRASLEQDIVLPYRRRDKEGQNVPNSPLESAESEQKLRPATCLATVLLSFLEWPSFAWAACGRYGRRESGAKRVRRAHSCLPSVTSALRDEGIRAMGQRRGHCRASNSWFVDPGPWTSSLASWKAWRAKLLTRACTSEVLYFYIY